MLPYHRFQQGMIGVLGGVVLVTSLGCSTPLNKREKGALIGGGAGAGVGALIGGGTGAAIGGALEGAVVGGLSALGAGLYSIGIPKDSIMEYETALKSDKFLVIAHGTAEEVAQPRASWRRPVRHRLLLIKG